MKISRIAVPIIFWLVTLVCSGCGGGNSVPTPDSQRISVSVSSSNSTVLLGNTVQFTSTVTGSSNLNVTWSVNGIPGGNLALGTISSTGLYTAPADLPTPTSITVAAASQADPSRTGGASITVTSDVVVTVMASIASGQSIAAGETVNLSAGLTSSGHPDKTVAWSVNGIDNGNSTVGTITSNGPSAIYVAPTTLSNLLVVTITAKSIADSSRSASSQFSVIPVLFSDDFSGSFPGLNWTITGGRPIINHSIGHPEPSLELGNGGFSSVQTAVNPFPTFGGMAFSVDIAFQDLVNVARIGIDDVNGAHLMTAVITGNSVFLSIDGASTKTFNFDTNFHRYTFQVDSSGNVFLLRDGIEEAVGLGILAAERLPLVFGLFGGVTDTSAKPVFFDNVRVVGTPLSLPPIPNNTLFSDDFSGSFPGANWTVTGGTPIINQNIGNPGPSLELGNGGFSSVQTAVNPFPTSGGMAFSVDIAFQDTVNVARIGIDDVNSVHLMTAVISGNGIFLSGASTSTKLLNFDTNFHRYTFQVDTSGNALLLRDGIEEVVFPGAFTVDKLPLVFVLNGGTTDASAKPIFFDNVRVGGKPLSLPPIPNNTLFSDDFSGSFPGANWTVTGGTPIINQNIGNPGPSLELGNGGFSSVQTAVNPFPTSGGMAFSVDIAFQDTVNVARIGIDDVNSVHLMTAVISGSGIFLSGASTSTKPLNFDTNFHRYTFQVDTSGNALLLRDGIEEVVFLGAFTVDKLPLVFALNGGTTDASAKPIFLDNVKVVGFPISVEINPLSGVVQTNSTLQFAATVTGSLNTRVKWGVNGTAGGNAKVGTISSSGLYTAPATAPNPSTVMIGATSIDDPSKSATSSAIISSVVSSASQFVKAAQGATISLPDGSNVVVPPGALSSDQEVELDLVSALPHQPPDQLITSVGPGLVLKLSSPNPLVSQSRSSLNSSGSTPAGVSSSSQDLQFSINISSAISGLQGSASMANLVDSSDRSSSVGVNGTFDSVAGVAKITVPPPIINGISSVEVSLANWIAGGFGALGPRLFIGNKWFPFSSFSSCPAGKVLLLVHGLASTVDKAFGCADSLRQAGGYSQVIGFNYDATNDIALSGNQLAEFLNNLATECAGITDLDIEGQSEGGLVAVSAAVAAVKARPDTRQLIQHITALGTPFEGTPVATLASSILTGLLNRVGSLHISGQTLQDTLKAPFLRGLTPNNNEVPPILNDLNQLLPDTQVIVAAGTVPDFSRRVVSVLKPLFVNEDFDDVVGTTSALAIGSNLKNIVRIPAVPLGHMQLECGSPTLIQEVGGVVQGQPLLQVQPNPPKLTFVVIQPPATDQAITLSSTGAQINWTATNSQTWLSISPSAGTTPATITVSVDVTGLASGFYHDVIDISAPDAVNSTVRVPITLKVGQGGGVPELGIPIGQSLSGCVDARTRTVDADLLVAEGGAPTSGYTWTLATGSNFPPGTTVDSATGVFHGSGGQITAGSFSFVMNVTDGSQTATASFPLTVNTVNSPNLCAVAVFQQDNFDTTLPDANAGSGYGAALFALGGTPPFSWSLATGDLPPGIVLDGTHGLIRGTPAASAAGNTFSFTIKITDSVGRVADCPNAGICPTYQVTVH